MLIEKTVREYISQASSGEPTPGGGSVAALAGSLGSGLTSMVANLTFGKKAYEALDQDVQDLLNKNFELIGEKTEALSEIIDTDASAFDDVMLAFRLPKETDEEKAARSEAIQAGYKKALEIPMDCAEICYEVLELQDVFAHNGNINAITDVGVGALLAYTGLEGALLNVSINLQSIKDEAYRKEMEDKVEKLLADGKKLKDELMKVVYQRLG